ncbi:uncharacterized protein LOC135140021 [Zophobas morio]|uniref:uncharacterized protein LOC135140021 n=1 Tax=Zophobas morio TaxID=2755281 RepID=UPI003082EECF
MNPEEELPPDVLEEAQNVVLNLLPTKSREVYECAYTRFIKWCEGKKIQTYSENVLLVYFSELATKVKSSTLWSHYSMVKATLNIKNGIEIGKYSKLKAFIKKQGEGYVPKKSRVLTNEQIEVFLDTAPDFKFLMMKIVVIFGVSGACRCHELLQIKTEDIENIKAGLLVKIPDTKTKKPRSFTVMGEKYLKFYQKYVALRPKMFNEGRFFIKYVDGMCHRQVVGIHKISAVPQEVAKYLKLENFKEYSGHCLRRTSATLFVDSGGDITSLKRHGGWKSDSVAEGYIEESLKHKKDVAKKIFRLEEPGTSSETTSKIHEDATNRNVSEVNLEESGTSSGTTNRMITREDGISRNVGAVNLNFDTVTNQTAGAVEVLAQNIITDRMKNDNSDGKSLIQINRSCSYCTFNINFKI